jgi:hypothetical protein
MNQRASCLLLVVLAATLCYSQAADEVRTVFHVRYVAGASVYLDGGRDAGLAEGMRLLIAPPPSSTSEAAQEKAAGSVAAELKVISVANASAVCEVVSTTRDLVPGDVATLHQEDTATLVTKRTLSSSRVYPAIVSFTEGDPMDEDVRDETPRPPLPEVNRARGRIGFEYSGIFGGGPVHSTSSELGMVFRADITRIGGTYWNLSGYWRGRLESQSSGSQQTLQDLMNRTYHLSLAYANPNSKWVAGVGRMYLPWASSLDTIDGGYVGRKLNEHTVAGFFGGSTPDPTSWDYNPNRRLAGSFVSFDQGSFDTIHSMTTIGMGVSTLNWTIDRPFVFTENTISYKQFFSIYDAFKIDRPHVIAPAPAVNAGLGQAFVSLRLQASRRVGFDLNYNYFRDVPTYDPQLIGTGLLDKYLFQGLSGGVRVEGPKHLTFYTEIGRSNSSSDTTSSWNKMFGVTAGQLWHTGLRLDARYSFFNSAFAQGSYRSLSLSRNIGEAMRLELQVGNQSFNSSLTHDNGSRFLNSMLEWNIGSRYFIDSGFTLQHGSMMSYRQAYFTFGYRFDNRSHKKIEVKP